nr:RNA-directed DNA polymerase, eukaryota [Tanacetum cinerariifolium]
MNAKLASIHEKYNHCSETHIGGSSSQTHEIGDVYLIAEELHQLHLDEEALRETLEGQTMDEKVREEKIRQKQADDDEYFMIFGMDSNFTNENDPWEYSLDIDDSDLHLTHVLRSSSSVHVEPSPYTTNSVTILPGPASVVQLSNNICVEPSSSTSNPVRIIPGHAGLVQRANLLKENVFILDPDGALMSTKEYMQKVAEDVGEDIDFNSGAWVSATNYVNAFGGTITVCLGDIDNFLKKEKLEQVVAIVKSCSPNALGDLNVTLKDLSVPKGVLKEMEAIRCKFFNGADPAERKITWVSWDKVLASEKNGGLGVSSFHALNRALLLKWVWRFLSQDGSLWYRVIQALYGASFELHLVNQYSIWCSILREMQVLISKGFDFVSHCKKRVGDGHNTRFWYDSWVFDQPLRVRFPRLFALETDKESTWDDLNSISGSVTLSASKDRWICDLNGDGVFRVKEVRSILDDIFLLSAVDATRWEKYIPIKINVFVWRARLDRFPTRSNLVRRGVVLDPSLCPLCGLVPEDIHHVLFRCDTAKLVFLPKGVLKEMEAIRCKFFNGVDPAERKITWVSWDKVLASKKNGGLGVSSFHALNRALLLKWVWRFLSQDGSLWYHVIQALYGASFELHPVNQYSIWCSILREMQVLISKGFDFVSHCKKRVGDGHNTRFWYDSWVFDQPLRVRFPRLFPLETDKESTWDDLNSVSGSVTLSASKDRWICNLNGDGVFRVKEVRTILDDIFLLSAVDATRWVKYIPIKINVFAWRARLDRLPTRSNLVRRGVVLDPSLCPLCGLVPEDIHHVLFRCDTAKLVFRMICRWLDLDWHDLLSFSDWNAWFSAIRLPSRIK